MKYTKYDRNPVQPVPVTPVRETIKDILIRRDEMTEGEALDLIQQAKLDLEQGLSDGEPDYDICEKWFGLEPDYIDELLDMGI
jgi:hypothetical protein